MVVKSSRYTENDIPFRSKVAILVTSWGGHLTFLKETLKSYMKTDAYVICSYDHNGRMPPQDIIDIPHAWVFKHRTHGAEKRNGWLWDIVYGGGLLHDEYTNLEYVFTLNGDCIWEKPQYMWDMVEYLGENDMTASSSNGTIHTCAVLYKAWLFRKFSTLIKHKLEINKPESYSPEVLLRDYVKDWHIDNKVPEVQARFPENHRYAGAVDHYSSYGQDSTWKRILGFRNLGGELKAACQEHLEPVEKEYIDIRNNGEFLNQHERTTLFHYYKTGDRRWLYKYWAEGEDSYWNRRYHDIEYYGKEPLHDDSKREQLGPPSERLGFFDRWKYFEYIMKDYEYHNKWKDIIDGTSN